MAKIRTSWQAYWDMTKTICVEKTPGNLLMTRFLQAAFPNSYFIIVKRHPVPVGLATQKWKINVTSLYNLFEHWLQCHSLIEEDKKYLQRVYELKYEDYVENPDKYHEEIAAFIGTRVPEAPRDGKFRTVTQWRNPSGLLVPEGLMEQTSGAHNKKYFDRWRRLLINSTFRSYYRYIAKKYEPHFAKYGYSLTKGLGINEEVLHDGGRVSALFGVLCCLGADVGAFGRRSWARTRWSLKLLVKALLPEFVLMAVRRRRQRLSPLKSGADAISS